MELFTNYNVNGITLEKVGKKLIMEHKCIE